MPCIQGRLPPQLSLIQHFLLGPSGIGDLIATSIEHPFTSANRTVTSFLGGGPLSTRALCANPALLPRLTQEKEGKESLPAAPKRSKASPALGTTKKADHPQLYLPLEPKVRHPPTAPRHVIMRVPYNGGTCPDASSLGSDWHTTHSVKPFMESLCYVTAYSHSLPCSVLACPH